MVDNREAHEAAWIEIGKRWDLGVTSEYYRAHIHGRSNTRNARILLGDDSTEEQAKALAGEKEEIYRQMYGPNIRPIDGLTDLLALLKEVGVPCATVSNAPGINVDMVMDALDLRGFFEIIVDRDQVVKGKPEPDMLLKAVNFLGLPPAQCLVFEDSISGFGSAEAAGTPYVVVKAGAEPDAHMDAKCPVDKIHDFTEVTLDRLRGWVGVS